MMEDGRYHPSTHDTECTVPPMFYRTVKDLQVLPQGKIEKQVLPPMFYPTVELTSFTFR